MLSTVNNYNDVHTGFPGAQLSFITSSFAFERPNMHQPEFSPQTRQLKRKTDADLLVSDASPKRGRPATHPATTAILEPDPDSINAILRKHCRTRLFVHPIRWTTEQLELLQCRFAGRTMPPPPATVAIPAATEAEEAHQRPMFDILIAHLQRKSAPKFHWGTIVGLLANLGIHTTP